MSMAKGNVGGKVQNVIGNVFGAIGGFFTGITNLNRYRFASVMIFFLGVYTTSLLMESIGNAGFKPDGVVESITIGVYTNQLLGAFFVQILFTILEAPVFNRQINPISLFVVVIDTFINSIVVKPFAEGFVNSTAYGNMVSAIKVMTLGYVDFGSVDQVVIITILYVFGGFAIAAAPEMFWSMGSKRPVQMPGGGPPNGK